MSHWAMNSSKFLSDEEDKRLLNRLIADKSRNALMLLILRSCGIRSSELRGLRVCDLNRSTGTIRVTASKGSNDRELPLPAFIFVRLLAYADLMHGSEKSLLFPISRSRLSEIWRGYRPIGCGKGLHAMRHTCAVEAYKKTKDLLFVKALLGHRSIASTMIYQEFAYTDQAFKDYMGTFGDAPSAQT